MTAFLSLFLNSDKISTVSKNLLSKSHHAVGQSYRSAEGAEQLKPLSAVRFIVNLILRSRGAAKWNLIQRVAMALCFGVKL